MDADKVAETVPGVDAYTDESRDADADAERIA